MTMNMTSVITSMVKNEFHLDSLKCVDGCTSDLNALQGSINRNVWPQLNLFHAHLGQNNIFMDYQIIITQTALKAVIQLLSFIIVFS